MPKMLLSLLLLIMMPHLAVAAPAASDWQDEDFASVRLISARDGVANTDILRLGLEFQLQSHWKIYWRSPGDAGFPPQPDWQGSENIGDATILWPAPYRFSILGMETFGYEDHVILPIDVAIPDPTRAAHINLAVDYLACSDICVPATAQLTLDLPADNSAISNFAHSIEKFAAKVPLRGDNLPLTVSALWQDAQTGSKEATLHVALAGLEPDTKPEILIEAGDRLAFGAPMPAGLDAKRNPVYSLAIHGLADGGSLTGSDVTVTVIAGPLAIEQSIGVTAPPEGAVTGNAGQSLWLIGALALLGGFILNFMPCVLPVLSMKVMAAVKASGQAQGDIRRGFLASAAGIVVSFWLLALALMAIKAAGGAIGWGIQFQQPLFLTVMTIIVALFAFNMWGLFDIGTPGRLDDQADQAIRRQEQGGHHLGGHFLTGMFATLLATPCSAPFLGTAVGFALAGRYIDIFWIFTLLGVGLALPYLAIAAWPGMARILPRPGRWMGIFKAVLGLALIGTAIWLLGILAVQIGLTGVGIIGGALMLAGLVLAWRHSKPDNRHKPRLTALAGLAVLVALFAPGFTPRPDIAPTSATGPLSWQAFEPETIAARVANGETVFVDITAEWCVTCQVNKKLVLETADIVDVLQDVVLMQGDWTRPDPVISHYLAGFGRYGIPFNIVYGPDAPDGIVLSELLSASAVQAAIRQAGGAKSVIAQQTQ